MKAVKLNKIQWDLTNLEPAERGKVKVTLPTSKGFMASDDFEVVEKVPHLLKKKYGYDIIDFSYTEIHIVESFEALMRIFASKDDKNKDLFLITGELSKVGKGCWDALINAIKERKAMDTKGTPEENMPKLLDKVMLSIEKITGMEWDGNTEEEIIDEMNAFLQDKIEEVIKVREIKKGVAKKYRKSLRAELKAMDGDDDEDDEQEEE